MSTGVTTAPAGTTAPEEHDLFGSLDAFLDSQQLAARSNRWAAILCAAPAAALLACLATALLYIASGGALHLYALAIGAGGALAASALYVLLRHEWTGRPWANAREFSTLQQRLATLASQMTASRCGAQLERPPQGPASAATIEAERQLCLAHKKLRTHSINWPMATGYVNVWSRLHRAEEALVMFAPVEEVAQGAA
jgi:hypothetical protein